MKNLKIANTVKLLAKLDKAVNKNDKNSVGAITFFLPLVSPRKPHKCELTIIPINNTVLKIFFCVVVRSKSHATGSTNPIPSVSIIPADKMIPEIPITK